MASSEEQGPRESPTFYQRRGKRLLDLAITIPALVLLSPLLALLGLLVYIRLGVPILFRQQRPGLHRELFTLYKFRTMTDERDADGNLLPDERRITLLGRLLRKTSLDELPELWNVVKREMSLVGPRPLLIAYLPYYTERESKRNTVRPGMTGLAQISGRNRLGWDERLELDVQYVESISLTLDLRILLTTVWRVVALTDSIEVQRTVLRPLTEVRQERADRVEWPSPKGPVGAS